MSKLGKYLRTILWVTKKIPKQIFRIFWEFWHFHITWSYSFGAKSNIMRILDGCMLQHLQIFSMWPKLILQFSKTTIINVWQNWCLYLSAALWSLWFLCHCPEFCKMRFNFLILENLHTQSYIIENKMRLVSLIMNWTT
jgi:hypothetical protein